MRTSGLSADTGCAGEYARSGCSGSVPQAESTIQLRNAMAAAQKRRAVHVAVLPGAFMSMLATPLRTACDWTVAICSAESERKRFRAGIEEFDLELAVADGLRLPDQLIKARCAKRSVAL